VLREKVVGEKEEGPHLAAVSCRGILCQTGMESPTLALGNGESCCGLRSRVPYEKRTCQTQSILMTSLVCPPLNQPAKKVKPSENKQRDGNHEARNFTDSHSP
jgi:hypothetical protein